MRNKLILFLMLALFGSTSFLRADEVQIGEGTNTNSYLPSYSLYNYSLTQQIYTAEEIGVGAGTISSIAFYNGGSEKTREYDVYFVNTTKASFDGTTDWITVTAADKVFTGTVTMVAGEWTTFTLTTPFAYDGTNLAVIVDDNSGSWSSGMSCRVFDASNQAIRVYSDPTNYDPTNPGTYTGTLMSVKNQIVLNIETAPLPPTPPTPTGEFSITPNDAFALGSRPSNGWMEPFTVRLYNGGVEALVSASISNTSEQEPFIISQEIDNVIFATGEALEFEVEVNENAPDGDYAEEFTLFYAENERDITTIPVTAEFYTAGEADIVETAKTISLSFSAGEATFNETPANLHANYILPGMTERKMDAVYFFNINIDSKVTVNAGNNVVAIYKRTSNFHPTAASEPMILVTDGTITEQVFLRGNYYMIVAGDNITTIQGTVKRLPAPTEITNLTPADGAMGLEGNIELTWEGGENATQYRVLFGTSPTNLPVAMDWTPIDDNYGAFDVTDYVSPNTQYFWQIEAKNSRGTVTSPRWGFTTALISPNTVTATPEEIFVDETTLIKWKLAGTGSFNGNITVADGTATSSYVPVYGLWMDDYTRGEMIYPAEMLEEMTGGEITSMVFYISSPASGAWTGDLFNVYLMEVDATTLSSYYTATNATIVYTGSLDGQGTTMNIVFDQPYAYGGGNLLVGIEEFENGTYKSCSFYGVAATGASASGYSSASLSAVTFNQRDFLPKVTFHCGDERNINIAKGDRTFQGFNVYYGDVKANTDLITENKYVLGDLPYNVTPGHNVTVTAVYSEGESEKSAPVVVKVSGYGNLTGTVTELMSGSPMAGVTVAFNGMDEFGNPVAYNGTTNASGVYTIANVKAGTYNIGKASLEGFEDNYMSGDAVVAYEGTTTVNFIMHESYNPVYKVFAQELEPSTAKVMWSLHDFVSPTPNNPGGGGAASTFSEGFEGGLPSDWTVIDNNNDGWTWCTTTDIPSTWTYYASLSLDWYRTGTNAICSGSYINGVGAVNPDEYLVTPQVTLANGSTFSFWAAATDASYPADHFGVFVSDNGTSDWTMVNEWTLTAKSGVNNGGRESRDGEGAKLGTWYQYSVDLSAYAGQKYIAIRHFNCYDQYIMCVDDIELTVGSKGNRSVQDYAIFRKAILKENGIVPADSVYFGTVSHPDSLYADFDWNNVEPGLYQYGVAALYPGYTPFSRGDRSQVVIDFETGDLSQLPSYTTSAAYPWTVVSGGHTGMAMKSSNGGVASSTSQIDVTFTYPTDGSIDFWALCMGEGTSTFWDKCIFEIDGVVQFSNGANVSGWQEYNYEVTAGEHTFTWKYTKDSSVNPTGDYMMVDDIVFDYVGAEATNDNPVTPITWSNILPKDMTTYVAVNAVVPVGSAEGTEVRFHNTFENVSDIVVTLDSTGAVAFEDFRKGNYTLTVDLEGYTCSYANTPVSIWADTTVITAILEEIYKPVDAITVSQTGFARWDNVIPQERVAERYVVTLDGTLYTETTDNFLQFEGLTEGRTYDAGVAVIYSTGMSIYKHTTFTYVECIDDNPVTDLAASNEGMDVTLTWSNGSTPPTPPPTGGDVVVKLTAGNVWGDGTGYQMLLDQTHSLYGSTIPTSGALSTNCSGNEAIYAQFSHKIPTNADGNCTTNNIVFNNTVEITIPAGTYDWCIVNPTPGDRLWIAASNGNVGGRQDDYVFEGGHTYEFTISMYGSNDGVDVSITGGKALYQPSMGQLSLDVRTTNDFVNNGVMNAGQGYGMANNGLTDDGNWYYYDNGINEDAIGTGGGNFWWGIMLPAGQYEGTQLTKVAAYDYMAMTGTATIYQGGTAAPAGSALGSTNVTFTGSNDFVEFEFATPVTLDPDQNVWVVFYNGSAATYPAAVCANTGSANGRWVSLDGTTWEDLAGYGLDYTFMVRAYIESGSAPVGGDVNITPNKYNIFVDGELVGVAAANATSFTWTCPDYAEHLYEVVWIDSNYNFYCPAAIPYQIFPDNIGENSVINAIYPNPTNGNLYVKATDMVRISVVNMLGQVVYDMAVEGDETVINMGNFEAGLYMVNVVTKNGSSVERVVVK